MQNLLKYIVPNFIIHDIYIKKYTPSPEANFGYFSIVEKKYSS